MEMARFKRTTVTPDTKIHAGLTSIYGTGKLADFTINVEDKQFKVSKIVLASQSLYFRQMFLGEWKESKAISVRLVDEDPTAISDMLQFLYSGIYHPTITSYLRRATTATATGTTMTDTTESIPNITQWQKAAIAAHLAQYTVGDMFFIPTLKHTAKVWFNMMLEKVCDHSLLLDVLNEVYTTVPGLRALTLQCIMRHIEVLLKDERFKKMMVEMEGLAVDVASSVLRYGTARRMGMVCLGCGGNEMLVTRTSEECGSCGCGGTAGGEV